MKSITIVSSLLSLGGIMISSTTALPTELTTRDTPKPSSQTCLVELWQRSRKSSSKEDPYWLHVYVEDGTGDKRNVMVNTFNPVLDKNAMKIPTPVGKTESNGKPIEYDAELSIKTPGLSDKKFKTEEDRDNAALSFQINDQKWTSNDGQRCGVSKYAAEKWDYMGVKPGEGPTGYPGKEYRYVACTFTCSLAENTQILKTISKTNAGGQG
ncbi:MAG: hypothetical protein M1812_001369 [Candelaria pacifica]|nr:MAG: hypothetical protein M1812_001369 [Candelaria pacifica]